MSFDQMRAAALIAAAGVVCGVAGIASADISGVYDVALVPTSSGLNATIAAEARTAGTLIGDFDAVDNPTGTRTKPGLLGPFGNTENVPVPVTLSGGLTGPINSAATGGLRIAASGAAGELSGLSIDLLGGSAVSVPLSVTLTTETFRTRNPTFLYPGGVPITIPLGEATVSSLRLDQVGVAAGTLTPADDGAMLFEAAVVALFTVRLDFLGTPVDVPGAPIVLPVSALLRESGDTLSFAQSRSINIGQTAMPDVELPTIPFALPTLSPETPANVVLSLRVSELSAALNGDWLLAGEGRLVPAAPAPVVISVGMLLCATRRHRRIRENPHR